MNERTRAEALKALDGMASIVKKDRLLAGAYVAEVGCKLGDDGSLCGAPKACAVGSLFLGAGIRPVVTTHGGLVGDGDFVLEMPGLDGDSGREDFMRNRHGLRAAYDALNAAALRYIEKNNVPPHALARSFKAPVEQLFEGTFHQRRAGWGSSMRIVTRRGRHKTTRKEILRVVNDAKRIVRAA